MNNKGIAHVHAPNEIVPVVSTLSDVRKAMKRHEGKYVIAYQRLCRRVAANTPICNNFNTAVISKAPTAGT